MTGTDDSMLREAYIALRRAAEVETPPAADLVIAYALVSIAEDVKRLADAEQIWQRNQTEGKEK